jgi:hypothetical protein
MGRGDRVRPSLRRRLGRFWLRQSRAPSLIEPRARHVTARSPTTSRPMSSPSAI